MSRFPYHCDSCHDDISVDCHDCEQHQHAKARATELCAQGTRYGLCSQEEKELQELIKGGA